MTHDDDRDTPPPKRQQSEHHLAALSDSPYLLEWRREQGKEFREIDRRLSGIEAALGDFRHALDKHHEQIRNLAQADSDTDRACSELDKRIRLLERSEEIRTQLAENERSGLWAKSREWAASALVTAVVLFILGMFGWVALHYGSQVNP